MKEKDPFCALFLCSFLKRTHGGAIALQSSVDGAYRLTLASGGGAISLGGAVGGTAPLTALTVGGGTTTVSGDVTLNNGVASFENAVVLGNTIQMQSGSTSGSILFSSTLDATSAGAQGLTLTSSGGSISFGAAVGSSQRLGALTLNGSMTIPSTFFLGTNVQASSVAASLPTLLTADSSVDTSTAPGAISWTGSVDGAHAFTATAGTSALSLAAVGASAPLSSLNATGAIITLSGNQFASGAMRYSGPVTAAANAIVETSGSGGLTFTSTLAAPGDLILKAPSGPIAVAGALSTTGGEERAAASPRSEGAASPFPVPSRRKGALPPQEAMSCSPPQEAA